MKRWILAVVALIVAGSAFPVPAAEWRVVVVTGSPTGRHECGLVAAGGLLYLLGGRGEKPVDVFDPSTSTWRDAGPMPIELHHFQPVEVDGLIYIVGAMTGSYPDEQPVPNVWTYDPVANTWRIGPEIPPERRRGAAGTTAWNGRVYLVGGIVNGHFNGTVRWFDEFDPATGAWRVLPDAMQARDHAQAAMIGNILYFAGGRTTSAETNQVFELTIGEAEQFNFSTGQWSSLATDLPTQRAGAASVAMNGRLLVIGGESKAQPVAHAEVEAYDPATGVWDRLPDLADGRHGIGAAIIGGKVYTVAGSADRGGGPELTTIEVLDPAD